MSKTTIPLTAERWAYLKNLRPAPGRLFWLSKPLVEITSHAGLVSLVPAMASYTYQKPETKERKLRELTARHITKKGVAL